MTASNLTKQAVNGYVSAVGRSKNSLGVEEQCGGHNLPSVGIGLSCLRNLVGQLPPYPFSVYGPVLTFVSSVCMTLDG